MKYKAVSIKVASRTVAVWIILAVVCLGAPNHAAADAVCTFDTQGSTLTVVVTNVLRSPASAEVRIRTNGDLAVFKTVENEFKVSEQIEVPCTQEGEGVTPTSATTEMVQVVEGPQQASSHFELVVESSDLPESGPGGVEPEFTTSYVASSGNGSMVVNLRSRSDTAVELGSPHSAPDGSLGVNTNADEESAVGSDAEISGQGIRRVAIATGDGSDTVDTRSGESFPQPPRAFVDVSSGGGNDTILSGDRITARAGAGDDSLFGGPGIDSLDGEAGSDFLAGGAGDDILSPSSVPELSSNVVLGGEGDDGVGNTAGDDYLDGGPGNDQVGPAAFARGLRLDLRVNSPQDLADSGTDTLISFESAMGTPGRDVLIGTTGSNVLSGFAGNDLMIGNGGSDVFVGGDGPATVSYANVSSSDGGGIVATLASEGPGSVSGEAGSDLLYRITRVIGTRFDDRMTGSLFDETFIGGAGDDRLSGAGGSDVLRGAMGDDRITGGAGADTLMGEAGLDALFARDDRADQRLSCGVGGDQAERITRDSVDPPASSC